MSTDVYYSDIWMNFSVYAKVNYGIDPEDRHELYIKNKALLDQRLERSRRYERAEKLSADDGPSEFFVDRGATVKSLPQVFFANNYIVVQQKCADILNGFDLGQTELVPVKFFQADRKTELEGRYYLINFGAKKNVFLPQKSLDLKAPYEPPNETRWRLPLVREDNQIAVSSAATVGPDMWHDLRLKNAVFFSSALHDALKAAKLDKPFKFYKCRVVGE